MKRLLITTMLTLATLAGISSQARAGSVGFGIGISFSCTKSGYCPPGPPPGYGPYGPPPPPVFYVPVVSPYAYVPMAPVFLPGPYMH